MLVISSSLVLVDVSTQFSLDNPIIGYDNVVTFSGISASSSDASGSFPATNMANPATHLLWRAGSTAAQSIIVQNIANKDIEFVGIARHNIGSSKASIRIQGSTDGGSTYADLTSDQLVPNDDPLMFRFTRANYTHIKIVLGASSGDPLAIAVVYVAPLLTLQRRIYVGHTPITYGRQTATVNGMSESGQFLGRLLVAEGRSTSVSMKNLTPDWYRAYLDPFFIAAKKVPFFFAWRPKSYPNEVGYCWLASDPKPTNQGANGMMSCDMSVGGIGSLEA